MKDQILNDAAIYQLKGYIARLTAIREQIAILKEEEQHLYNEARACGFDKRAIRDVVNKKASLPAVKSTQNKTSDLYETLAND